METTPTETTRLLSSHQRPSPRKTSRGESFLQWLFGVVQEEEKEEAVIETVEPDRRYWTKGGKLHRDGDLPAVERSDGTRKWYQNGKLHRNGDKPAVIEADGTEIWYQLGQIHRGGDKPAVIWAHDGTQLWYLRDQCHRDGDLPAFVAPDGSRWWFQYGQEHRDGDQPAAITAGGSRLWYQRGELHRDGDLPAVIDADGAQWWWMHGRLYREDANAPVYVPGNGGDGALSDLQRLAREMPVPTEARFVEQDTAVGLVSEVDATGTSPSSEIIEVARQVALMIPDDDLE